MKSRKKSWSNSGPTTNKKMLSKSFGLKEPYLFAKYYNKPTKKTKTLPTDNIIRKLVQVKKVSKKGIFL